MTLDEAIKHCEEVAKENDDSAKEFYRVSKLETHPDRKRAEDGYVECKECADAHRQLAEWLKELKQYRELFSCPEEAATVLTESSGKPNHWIPVSERLPDENKIYPVWFGMGYGNHLSSAYYSHQYGWSSHGVVAWMNPEPYKVGEDNAVN